MYGTQVIVADAASAAIALSGTLQLCQSGSQVEFHLVGTAGAVLDAVSAQQSSYKVWDALQAPSFRAFLERQLMGTHFHVYLAHDALGAWRQIAREIGIGPDEMTLFGTGVPCPSVFCVGCYATNPPTSDAHITCRKCQRLLRVSAQWSERLQAVLGYLVPARMVHRQELADADSK